MKMEKIKQATTLLLWTSHKRQKAESGKTRDRKALVVSSSVPSGGRGKGAMIRNFPQKSKIDRMNPLFRVSTYGTKGNPEYLG